MKAYHLQGAGLDSLRRVDLPEPVPGAGEVRIRVRAASVNYRDYALATGSYLPQMPRPFVPLSDGVGVIDAVGPGVDGWRPGQRVTGLYTTAWQQGPFRSAYHASKLGGPRDGWLAESIVLPAAAVLAVPDYLDDAEAATLPVSGLTAWTALARLPTGPGRRILVQGTGSVSLMALQLAAARGSEVIATTGNDDNRDLLRSLGASAVINYRRRTDLAAAVREVTDGAGVDGVVDVVGGQGVLQLLAALADNGHLAIVGFLGGGDVHGDLIAPIMARQLHVHGVSVGSREDFVRFLQELECRRIRPLVGERLRFEDAAEALALLARPRAPGKPVILAPSGC